jgi:hypothetical protein
MIDLPKVHPAYGGNLTFYKDLEVGTKFWVCNGGWEGEIILQENQKCYLVKATGEVWLVTEEKYNWLTILK